MSLDLRTKAGKAQKAIIVESAIALREEGWTLAQIAAEVAADPATLSMYLFKAGYRMNLSSLELRDRREAAQRGVPHEAVTRARVARQLAPHRERAAAQARRHRERAAAREARRQERRRAVRARELRRLRREYARSSGSAWAPVSLDAPVLRAPDVSVGSTIAARRSLDDPQTYVEHQERDAILGDLCVEDIGRMDEHILDRLREQLRESGYAPGGSQQKERDRLRDTDRHRGYAPPPTAKGMAPERKHAKQKKRREGDKQRVRAKAGVQASGYRRAA